MKDLLTIGKTNKTLADSTNSKFDFNSKAPTLDFSQLKIKILRSLRHPFSQREFSHHLGFKFNQVLKWETQQKKLLWSHFCQLCSYRNLILNESLFNVFCINLKDVSDSSSLLKQIFKFYYPEKNTNEIAQVLHLHPSLLQRWLKGTHEPEFEIILKLLHFNTQLLGVFLTQLMPNPLDSELTAFIIQFNQIRQLEAQLPYLSAVQSCLHLVSYHQLQSHSDEFVAQRTALPIWKVKTALTLLQERNWIIWNEPTKKYISPPLNVDMGGSSVKEILQISGFWTERALARIADPNERPINHRKNPNYIGYRIVPASKDSINKINEILIQTDKKILQILEEDPHPMEEIRVIVSHHFSADDIPF